MQSSKTTQAPRDSGFCRVPVVIAVGLVLSLAGCDTAGENIALGLGVGTLFGARAPTHEIQQTYYLGVFDPQSQLEPTVYRVRLHGQSSFINQTKFASGWLPSAAVDTLGTTITWDDEAGTTKIEGVDQRDSSVAGFQTGRRMVVFGPEGFREAPANYRLVVAMGTSPEAYFRLANEALAEVASVTQTPSKDAGASRFKDDLLAVREMLARDAQVIAQGKEEVRPAP